VTRDTGHRETGNSATRNRKVVDEASAHIRSGDRGLAFGFFYGMSVLVCRFVGLLFLDVRLFHVDRVPTTGPVVFAGNHQSFFDPVLVGVCFDRRVCYLARETLFRVPVLRWLLRRYDCLPVPRDSVAPRKALEVCVQVLKKGRALVLFPEGTRSRTGRLQPLKRGIALVARRSGAPVLPILIRGTHALWPPDKRLPRPGKVQLIYGHPLTMDPKESADSFMGRLSCAYHQLAVEVGAREVLPEEESLAGEGSEPQAPQSPMIS
jgi:1-acyl-sn-glycerol-3-phosphate acyltransferase